MNDFQPQTTYVFPAKQIWFFERIFVCQFIDCVKIMEYPNRCWKVLKKIDSIVDVKIAQKLQIIHIKNNNTHLIEIEISNCFFPRESRFYVLNDSIYYKSAKQDIKCLSIPEGIYNIILANCKIYRFILKLEHYVLEEYSLSIPQGDFIYDTEFFKKFNLKYDDVYIFSNNGNDFLVCVDNMITLNMTQKTEVKGLIIDADMTEKLIYIKTYGDKDDMAMINILDFDFKTLYTALCKNTTDVYLNRSYGIVIQHSEVLELISNSGVQRTQKYENKDIKSFLTSYNLGFSIHEDSIICYRVFQNHLLKLSSSPKLYNIYGEKIIEFGNKVVYKDHTVINSILAADFVSDDFFIIAKNKIFIKIQNYICIKSTNMDFDSYHADYTNKRMVLFRNNRKFVISCLDIVSAIILASDNFDDQVFKEEYKIYFEKIIIDLLLNKSYKKAEYVLTKIAKYAQGIICTVYRKSDSSDREFILKTVGNKFFLNLSDSESFICVFALMEVDLRNLVSVCVTENNKKLLYDVFMFLKSHSVAERISEYIDILIEFGCIDVLKDTKIIDAEFIEQKRYLSFIFHDKLS